MGAGYMSLDKGEMQWTLTYDEIDIVLEGELASVHVIPRPHSDDEMILPQNTRGSFGGRNKETK